MLADSGVVASAWRIWRRRRRTTSLTLRFLQDLPYGDQNRLEGYLFPDTYDFYVDDNPVRVINKMLANFDSKFTETMKADIDTLNESIRTRMENEGSFSDEEIDNAMMDVRKIITVASLIEKEAGDVGAESHLLRHLQSSEYPGYASCFRSTQR